jgi:hypothetical protein
MRFFDLYEAYTKDTEPPNNFHVWTAIGTISALLGRKCYIPQGHFTVYPNLYIVLTGPAGVKKSSSMNIGKRLLKTIPDFPLAPASTTREALLMSLEENRIEYSLSGRNYFYHQCSAFVTEMQEFIGGKHINQAMVGIMTAIWDEPEFEYKTANKGSVVIPSPYFTMVGCCTKDWITTKLKSDVITDGFARRVIFVLEEKRSNYVPWPETTPEKDAAFENLAHEAQRIRNLKGKFRFTDKARKLWDSIYEDIQKEVDSKDAYVQNYYGSKHTLIQKLCMCLSAAKDNRMIVDSEMLQLAHDMLLVTEENLLNVFQGLGRNELSAFQEDMYQYIQQRKVVLIPELIEKYSRDLRQDEYAEALNTLIERKKVIMEINKVRPAKQIETKERPNLFEHLKAYQGHKREAVSESAGIELYRLVDSKTLNQERDNRGRVELLKKGILATSDQLRGI